LMSAVNASLPLKTIRDIAAIRTLTTPTLEQTLSYIDFNLAKRVGIKMHYATASEFAMIAKNLLMIPDFRGGVPRMSYNGIVCLHEKDNIPLYLVPTSTMAKTIERDTACSFSLFSN